MKYTMLASNPTLYKSLYEEKSIEDNIGVEVEWLTPTSVEESAHLASMFEDE